MLASKMLGFLKSSETIERSMRQLQMNMTCYMYYVRNTDRRCTQKRSSSIWKNETRPHQRGSELAQWRVKGDDLLFGVSQLS
jgi:methylthioribose-1-phosphate isomerase